MFFKNEEDGADRAASYTSAPIAPIHRLCGDREKSEHPVRWTWIPTGPTVWCPFRADRDDRAASVQRPYEVSRNNVREQTSSSDRAATVPTVRRPV